MHCSTPLPSNCNDTDMIAREEAEITISTYTIIMAKMSLLLPDLLDGLSSIASPLGRYEHVIQIDARMRELVSTLPALMLRGPPSEDTSNMPWLPLARQTLAIAAADKILMIHRPFLVRSFQSPIYLFTRNTCVSAAITILREHESIVNASDTRIPVWSHSAFCVTAVIVLCLNILHGGISEETHQHHRHLVTKARTRLMAQKNDTMAKRGVYLTNIMLGERPNGGVRLDSILEKFWGQEYAQDAQEEEIRADSSFDTELAAGMEDFEVWFRQAFNQDVPS